MMVVEHSLWSPGSHSMVSRDKSSFTPLDTFSTGHSVGTLTEQNLVFNTVKVIRSVGKELQAGTGVS